MAEETKRTTDEGTKRSKTSLDASRGTVFHFPPEEIVVVGYDTNHAPGSHPLYPETEAARLRIPLDTDMLASIRQYGVIQAVTTVKVALRLPDDDAGSEPPKRPVLIAGRRRVLHAREVNRLLREEGLPDITVPVVVRSGSSLEDGRILSVIENEHRANTPTADKARTAVALIQRGVSREQVQMAFRMSSDTLDTYLLMGELHADVRGRIERGELPLSTVERISRRPYEEQPAYADELRAATARPSPAAGGGTGAGTKTGTKKGTGAPIRPHQLSADKLRAVYAGLRPDSDEARLVRATIQWVLTRETADPTLISLLSTVPEVRRIRAGKSGKDEAGLTHVPSVVQIPSEVDLDGVSPETELEAEVEETEVEEASADATGVEDMTDLDEACASGRRVVGADASVCGHCSEPLSTDADADTDTDSDTDTDTDMVCAPEVPETASHTPDQVTPEVQAEPDAMVRMMEQMDKLLKSALTSL